MSILGKFPKFALLTILQVPLGKEYISGRIWPTLNIIEPFQDLS